MGTLGVRGVIEGFYGPPWSPSERVELIEFCAERGMDAYVYAPKNDTKHRARWREPYDQGEQAMFAELARRCRACGVRLGFALSPGLDIDYGSAADRSVLLAKLQAAADLGVDWLVVAFDDLPGQTSSGKDQADLLAWLHEELADGGVPRLSLVPTEYAGTCASPYLVDLAAGLPPDVDVMWTGPQVVSPTITAHDARRRAQALSGRRPLLWDNYPVNDGQMEPSLFLGPYVGRDPALAVACSGILCNPMSRARASRVALATAAEFFRAPDRYHPEEAWERAISDVGGPGASVLRRLATACADSALTLPSATPAHRLLDRFEVGAASLGDLESFLQTIAEGDGRLPEQLRHEVGPWLRQLEVEAGAGRAAVRLLETVEAGEEEAAASAVEHMRDRWSRARAGEPRNVFGPRFACYPTSGVNARGVLTFDVGTGIVEDASFVDRLCRLAFSAYDRWVSANS